MRLETFGKRAAPSRLAMAVLLTAAVLLPRLLVFGVNENFYGDAVMRAELAGRWAERPHVIGSFDQGGYQFGPLHILALGVLTWVGGSRENSGRWFSLAVALLTVLPLFSLTRRLFGRPAAVAACLCLALWGMHVQFSTTSSSEALGLLLILATAALFARAVLEEHRASLLGAALTLNLACATRYDAWLWVPMLTIALLLGRRWKWAAIFGLLCLAFPLGWAYGNWGDRGDPLFPFRFIDQYHRDWFPDGERLWGASSYRLQNLVFWPAVALFTLSPLIGAAGLLGLVRAWRERKDLRWLVALIVVPSALFTFRSTITGSFVPLARFAAKEVALLLPFVWFGFDAFHGKRLRVSLAVAGSVVGVALPVALGLFTLHREGKWEDSLRPVSPISTNPVELMRVARFLEHEVKAQGEGAILDSDAQYRDLQLAFFSGLPEERLARHRWEIFPIRLAAAAPRFLVRIEGGTLERVASIEGRQLRFNGWTFSELDGFVAPFHVYRR
jgi:4-amino-4-deoxy-L-arabinose transferase-like glycosyltransferase